jgi:pyridine nucleotide-disulfide oxidoreductase family protein
MARNVLRIILVGGGHAHLEVLRRFSLDRRDGVEFTLVSAFAQHHYSGMVPGYLAGFYREEQISFDLKTLCQSCGAHFVHSPVTSVDTASRVVTLESGEQLDYDLCSFNIGSRTLGGRSPFVQKHAYQVKPISRVVQLLERVDELAEAPGGAAQVSVVGAGAGGVEVALAVQRFLQLRSRDCLVSLLDAGPEILPGCTDRLKKRAEKILKDKGIRVELNTRVSNLDEGYLETEAGERRNSDLTIWLTGPEAPAVFEGSGLALSADRFLSVDTSLRSISHPEVFGVGDCATMKDHPETPKAGVYAVRQAPVLWGSLMSSVEKSKPPRYQPQAGFLSIMSTGDGKALLYYKGLVSHSTWAWRLKSYIDLRFMQRYWKIS